MGMGGGGRRRTDGRVGEQSSLPLRVQCKVKARDRGSSSTTTYMHVSTKPTSEFC